MKLHLTVAEALMVNQHQHLMQKLLPHLAVAEVAAVPCEAPITVPLLTAMYTPVTVLMEETEKLL